MTIPSRVLFFFLLLVRALSFNSASAQEPNSANSSSKLTIDRIFQGNEFQDKSYGPVAWASDGKSYTLMEPAARKELGRDLVRYEVPSGAKTIVVPAERFMVGPEGPKLNVESYVFSANGKRLLIFTNSAKVWRQNTRGDFWVMDVATGKLLRLGGEARASSLQFVKFSPDGRAVGFVYDNDIYVQEIEGGSIRRLTLDGAPKVINGTLDWVYEEELSIRDGWRWSPDGRFIAFWQLDSNGVKEFTLINNTDEKYPITKTFPYPKAGETNSAARIGVVSLRSGETRWIDVPGDARNNYLARMDWAADSNELSILQMNRLQNRAIVYLANVRSGNVRSVLTETDDAWLDYWNDVVPGGIRWIDNGHSFLWSSERTGWRHIYRVQRNGSVKPVTHGEFDVDRVDAIDESGKWLYFTASPDSAIRRYLYRTKLDGSGEAERLTPSKEPGVHRYDISPRGDFAIHSWSTFTSPPRYELVRLSTHTVEKVLEDNSALTTALGRLAKTTTEFVQVDIGEGVRLDTWMIKPPNFDASKRYPMLMVVYGEPAGVTVTDGWQGIGYLWYSMLAQEGYVVASMDNRGTPSLRGRAWRKAVYKKLGVLPTAEQAAGVRALCLLPYIDSKRIGSWGWSGGGSMTLNALFQYPDLYRMGIAVAPGADMALYDTIYQERYMGLPQENADAYKRGSPIAYAKNLKGDLLIVHGTGDDNSHYQGTERLMDVLIAEDKPFTVMPYPNRTHEISERKNTTRHLFSLFTRYLLEKLPPGPQAETDR